MADANVATNHVLFEFVAERVEQLVHGRVEQSIADMPRGRSSGDRHEIDVELRVGRIRSHVFLPDLVIADGAVENLGEGFLVDRHGIYVAHRRHRFPVE